MFFIGMIVGMHVGYTIRVIMRSDNPALYDDHKGIKKMLTTLTFPAWISIFVWVKTTKKRTVGRNLSNVDLRSSKSVSYTHLTLPTIYSV